MKQLTKLLKWSMRATKVLFGLVMITFMFVSVVMIQPAGAEKKKKCVTRYTILPGYKIYCYTVGDCNVVMSGAKTDLAITPVSEQEAEAMGVIWYPSIGAAFGREVVSENYLNSQK